MTQSIPPRSPLLLSRHDSAVLVIDVQEKLVPAIRNRERLIWNLQRILDAAKTLDIPVAATEQYPAGLGETVAEILDRLPTRDEKVLFSCRECDSVFVDWKKKGIRQILITGMETHVCVMQTALDLIAQGFEVYLCVDAVSSRFELDHETAIRRMEASGVTLATTESAMFEWCETSKAAEFKAISQLVRQTGP